METNIDLIGSFILFGILQSLLIIGFLLIRKAYKRHFFFFLLGTLGLFLQIDAFLMQSGAMIHCLHLMNVVSPFVLLLGPFLYFYNRSLLGQSFSLKRSWAHFLPFAAYFLYSFYFFLAPWERKYNAYISAFDPNLPLLSVKESSVVDPLHIQGWIVVEGLVLHLLIYSLVSLIIFPTKAATTEIKKWLIFLNSMLLLGALILFGAEGGVINGKSFFPQLLPDYGSRLFGTLFTYGITAFLLSKTVIVRENKKKYYNSSLKKELKTSKLQKLSQLMEREKVYLDQEFSREKLARLTNISTNHLSQILNEELQINFFDWVNAYRIEEASRRLSDPSSEHKMEVLAYELGYKSKSTFFTNFKKRTGMTPLQFRKSSLSAGKVFS